MRKVVLNWVGGVKVVKKINAKDHTPTIMSQLSEFLKNMSLRKQRLSNKGKQKHLTSSTTFSTEESIFIHVSQLNQTQREQLLKRFQLTHFIVARNLLFKI